MTVPEATAGADQRAVAHDRFSRLLRAEWTKLTTVRGWIFGLVAASVTMVLLALPVSADDHSSCGDAPQCAAPVGPEGDEVSDGFYFVHQPLTGDGSITARVTSLTGVRQAPESTPSDQGIEAVEPWAKTGLMIKASTDPGSPYAAVMVTGSHGVRLQHNFTHDVAHSSAGVDDAEPRWLRLTREGDVITGDESTDGARWVEVGSIRLDDLPATVQVGLFTASPQHLEIDQQILAIDETGEPTQATGVFDQVILDGAWTQGTWAGGQIGNDPVTAQLGGFEEADGTFRVSGSGDIAPIVRAPELSIERTLVGTFAALIAVVVIAVMFITAEYRRGLIHITFAASPRRERVLAAKALVIGATTFTVGLVAAFLAVKLGVRSMRSNGLPVDPTDALTEARVIVGTAALLGVAAVLALAVGTVLRRSAGAVSGVIVAVVLPYILATASILPQGPSEWLLRLTPAAAFSIQQTLVEHPQVTAFYAPVNGYYPLTPFAGFSVLCLYTLIALLAATTLLRRRDT